MYKQLPDGVETIEQRKVRMQKQERELLDKGKLLVESLVEITPAIVHSVPIENSNIDIKSFENKEEKLRDKVVKEDIKNVFKKEIKKKKGRPFSKKRRD